MVIDASVAVKWFVEEDRSDSARSVLASGDTLIAPFTVLPEVAQALWVASRQGRTTAAAAADGATEMISIFPAPVFDIDLVVSSRRLMAAHNHPIYDCLYLALAERTKFVLLTADERQFSTARRARIEARLL